MYPRYGRFEYLFVLGAILVALVNDPLCADEVDIDAGSDPLTLVGNVVEMAQDKGMLFQTRDGRLWPLSPDKIREHRPDEEPAKPLSRKELGRELARPDEP